MVCHMFKIIWSVLAAKFSCFLDKYLAIAPKKFHHYVMCYLVLASKIFFPENASWLDGRIATF